MGQTSFNALHEKWKQEREIRYRRSMHVRQKLISEGRDIFKEFNLKKVVLYGSIFAGNMRQDSDIDILVDSLEPEKFFIFQCRLEERIGIPVDVHNMDEDEKFTRKMLQRGEVIYEI